MTVDDLAFSKYHRLTRFLGHLSPSSFKISLLLYQLLEHDRVRRVHEIDKIAKNMSEDKNSDANPNDLASTIGKYQGSLKDGNLLMAINVIDISIT